MKRSGANPFILIAPMNKTQAKTSQDFLRVGCVEYLNTLPFAHGLEAEEGPALSIRKAAPAELNKLLSGDELDLGIVSSFEYARNAKDYLILPEFCIGSNDFSDSVLLISKVPIQNLSGRKIILAGESLSSQVLLKILLKELNQDVQYKMMKQDPRMMLERGDAFLLIGDEALFYETPPSYYQYDLGHLWAEMTGLPFCFALWVVRRSFAENHAASLDRFLEILSLRFENNIQNLWSLIKDWGFAEMGPDEKLLLYDKCFHYLNNLEYRLTKNIQAGLQRYFEMAVKIGELGEMPKLEYFNSG